MYISVQVEHIFFRNLCEILERELKVRNLKSWYSKGHVGRYDC